MEKTGEWREGEGKVKGESGGRKAGEGRQFSIFWFNSHMSTSSKARPDSSQKSGVHRCRLPTSIVGPKHLGFSTAFPAPLAGSWMRSGRAGIHTGDQMRCQNHNQNLTYSTTVLAQF